MYVKRIRWKGTSYFAKDPMGRGYIKDVPKRSRGQRPSRPDVEGERVTRWSPDDVGLHRVRTKAKAMLRRPAGVSTADSHGPAADQTAWRTRPGSGEQAVQKISTVGARIVSGKPSSAKLQQALSSGIASSSPALRLHFDAQSQVQQTVCYYDVVHRHPGAQQQRRLQEEGGPSRKSNLSKSGLSTDAGSAAAKPPRFWRREINSLTDYVSPTATAIPAASPVDRKIQAERAARACRQTE